MSCRQLGHDWDIEPPSYMFNRDHIAPAEPTTYTCRRCGTTITDRPNGNRHYTHPTTTETEPPMFTTDNRWSPGTSGANVPDTTTAAYAARWIDQGDDVLADIVPDRQGFAYSDKADMERLIDLLGKAGDSFRTPHKVGLDQRDVTTVVMNTPEWKAYMRRSGGYIYVDAWLS